ncbi:hypothetical protein [Gracilibacillus halophilus]|nr:hypothetical protein [Gracilibacillus halophilus]
MQKQTTKKKNPLRIRKRFYGDIPKEEAFNKALEPYFKKTEQELVQK